MTALQALLPLWTDAALPPGHLDALQLPEQGPQLPSSFRLTDASTASLAAASLSAASIGQLRGGPAQGVTVDPAGAAVACTTHFALDGTAADIWDPLSGLYACADGHLRIHANFAHHREGALRLLGLPTDGSATKPAVAEALRGRSAADLEQQGADAGLVMAMVRTHAQWLAHPQSAAVASAPVLRWQRIGDAAPLPWPALPAGASPLHGLRVLDFTRILAGPVAGQLLAGHGADVLMVNGPHLPNIAHIAPLSRGKRSCQLDLRRADDLARLQALAGDAHVLLQGYRPGALARFGLDAATLAQQRPGIVVASLSAYGHTGPWGGRRGFDSLVQSATGFNHDEAQASGSAQPKAFPVQLLDHAAGRLLAFGIQAALWRQATEGGSWQVDLSLAGVGHWLRSLGRCPDDQGASLPPLAPWLADEPSGFGQLQALRHPVQFEATPFTLAQPAMPPGSHPPAWW